MDEHDRRGGERSEFDKMPLAERFVSPIPPGFEIIEPNVIRKLTHNDREIIVHHYNTMVVLYPEGPYERFDHIVITDPEQFPQPYYIFPELGQIDDDLFAIDTDTTVDYEFDDFFDLTISKLEHLKFTTVYPPYPMPYVIEQYQSYLRGNQTMDEILQRIIDESV
jgi:hypothetical protein